MVVCLERGADLHMAQLMPLPLTVSCFSKIQIGFSFLVLTYSGSPGKKLLNGCVCVCVVNACFCCVWFSFFHTKPREIGMEELAWGNVSEMTYFVSSGT